MHFKTLLNAVVRQCRIEMLKTMAVISIYHQHVSSFVESFPKQKPKLPEQAVPI